MTDVLSFEQVVEWGLRVEINRRLLFPAGLSMALSPGTKPGECVAVFRREGPDKCIPPGHMAGALERAATFEERELGNASERMAALGYLRQPLTDEPERIRLSLPDPDVLSAIAESALGRALANAPADVLVNVGDIADELGDALALALTSLCVVSTDGGGTWRIAPAPRPNVIPDGTAMLVSRGEHIVLDVRRMAAERASELMPGEVAEFDVAAAAFESARDAALIDALAASDRPDASAAIARLSDCVAELERLYALAQPGMRVHRGEPEAFAEWDRKARPALRDAVRSSLERMSDYELLTAGELWPWDDADWQALSERLGEDMAAARERAADAERELADAAREVEALERMSATVREALGREQAKTAPQAEESAK